MSLSLLEIVVVRLIGHYIKDWFRNRSKVVRHSIGMVIGYWAWMLVWRALSLQKSLINVATTKILAI